MCAHAARMMALLFHESTRHEREGMYVKPHGERRPVRRPHIPVNISTPTRCTLHTPALRAHDRAPVHVHSTHVTRTRVVGTRTPDTKPHTQGRGRRETAPPPTETHVQVLGAREQRPHAPAHHVTPTRSAPPVLLHARPLPPPPWARASARAPLRAFRARRSTPLPLVP
jgi:hypothetical protein